MRRLKVENFTEKIYDFISPSKNKELKKGSEAWVKRLPVLWLLGKTGAGKSSLIQALTNDTSIEIGNGFSPCTTTSKSYDYPKEQPILRFLDTRGLSEVGYDPTEDIAVCQEGSHALILMMKADDVEQSDLIEALKKIKSAGGINHLLVVHTSIRTIIDKDEREKAIAYNQKTVEEVWGKKINSVSVDFSFDDHYLGIPELKEACINMLPYLNDIIIEDKNTSNEEHNFNLLKKEIIWYSASAGASDALPGVGLISVPAIQGKMLHSLANQYGITWDKKTFSEFTGALGSSFAVKYGVQFLIREGVKFIPIYGQTVGSATAVMISSAYTYALGRAACYYLYQLSKNNPISKKEMKKLYKEAFGRAKEMSKNEK